MRRITGNQVSSATHPQTRVNSRTANVLGEDDIDLDNSGVSPTGLNTVGEPIQEQSSD
jgi:hypothetical protein